MKSKADARNSDGVTIVRLTSHSGKVRDYLSRHERLRHLVARVRDAGCEVSPKWANGALLFIPMMEDQAKEADITLKAHNVVLLSDDVELLADVLKMMPKRARKGSEVRPEYEADQRSAEMPSPDGYMPCSSPALPWS